MSHQCCRLNLELLKEIYSIGSWETLGVYRCRKCGQLWKIRFQYDAAGRDDIWLRPGETERGYSFSLEEAEKLGEDIKKAAEKKKKQREEAKRWKDEKDAQGYICHRCVNFWGEKDGKAVCYVEEMRGDDIVPAIDLTPHEYRRECEYFIRWHRA